MSAPALASVAGSYFSMFIQIRVDSKRQAEAQQAATRILRGQSRYVALANKLPNPPWWVIGLMHELECSCDFNRHLHNGDPLSHRTVNVPAGRPAKFPCTWEESAWDCLVNEKNAVSQWRDWSTAGALYRMEGFNGYGYHSHGINSPYLWAGSQFYTKGKFVADGVYDSTAVSKQLGVAVLLHQLCVHGDVALPGQAVHPLAGSSTLSSTEATA